MWPIVQFWDSGKLLNSLKFICIETIPFSFSLFKLIMQHTQPPSTGEYINLDIISTLIYNIFIFHQNGRIDGYK